MSSILEEARDTNWRSTVPIILSFLPHDGRQIPRMFIQFPRISYTLFLRKEVTRHVKKLIPDFTSDLWFEYEGKYVPWDLHVGVLFDCVSPEQNPPLSLFVNFGEQPTELKQITTDKAKFESIFVNQLKQSDFLKHGTKLCFHINAGGLKELWDSYISNQFHKFYEILDKYEKKGNLQKKRYAIRIYLEGEIHKYIQPSIAYEEGSTIDEVMSQVTQYDIKQPHERMIFGISPMGDSPADFLAANFGHPDGFLYIIVKKTTEVRHD